MVGRGDRGPRKKAAKKKTDSMTQQKIYLVFETSDIDYEEVLGAVEDPEQLIEQLKQKTQEINKQQNEFTAEIKTKKNRDETIDIQITKTTEYIKITTYFKVKPIEVNVEKTVEEVLKRADLLE